MATETFADRLARLRAHVPTLSLHRLGELAGLSRDHAGKIARGTTERPDDDTAAKIARVFGATALWLTHGVGREPGGRRVRESVEDMERRTPRAQSAPRRAQRAS